MTNTNIWQLQNAKNRLSELISIASKGTPQLITKNGRPTVYVVKAEDIKLYNPKKSIKDIILNCPSPGLNIPHDEDTGRVIEL